jgi:hypothetical protein
MTVGQWMTTLAFLAVQLAIAMWALGLGPYDPSRRLGCVIRGDRTCALGSAPRISVSLVNQFDSGIYLVGSLDASEWQWRYPHCYFEVTRPDGKPAHCLVARCGSTNALRARDFVKVPRGGKFDPYQTIDDQGFFPAHDICPETFSAPGTYHVRFVYSTRNGDIRDWGGGAVQSNAMILAKFKRVPKVDVKSNEIAITVVAAGN